MNICRFDSLKHRKIGSSYTQRYENFLIYANITRKILAKNTKNYAVLLALFGSLDSICHRLSLMSFRIVSWKAEFMFPWPWH